MTSQQQIEKLLLWIIKISLWALPILPLYISYSMLFPFITGKNFTFRIVVELLFVLWVGLAILRKEYRPQLTPLFKAITIFVIVVFLADFFSPNPYRAFFSNYERMEGFMMIFHLYLYFLMLASVFKTKRDWLVFLHSTLLVSAVVSLIALLQKLGLKVSLQGGFRVDATIGNPAYLAAYLLFHIWIMLLFIYQFWQKILVRALYATLLVFELIIIYFTATRGVVLSLIITTVLLLMAILIKWRNVFPQARTYWRWVGLGALAIMIAAPILIWQLRETNFVISNNVLQRLSSISLEDRTTRARFAIWNMSFHGALGRPVLGWGQENYYLIFQKYFDPILYSSEPWFDRSHNIIFDWLVHTGFLGLTSYLSILTIAVGGILFAIRKSIIQLWHGLILACLFISYFIQNFFVFDNLNTYLLFFGFLAYIQNIAFKDSTVANQPLNQVKKIVPPSSSQTIALSVTTALFIVVVISGYFLHVKPIQASRALIKALAIYQGRGPIDIMLEAFRDALSYNSFGNTEIREQLANIGRDVARNERFTAEEKNKFVSFAIEELKKETTYPAKDVKHMLFLASVLDRSGDLNPAYITEAEGLLREAINVSPTKQMVYFELAQVYLNQNKVNESIDMLKKAVELEPSYQQAVVNLIIVAQLGARNDAVEEAKKYLRIEIMDEETMARLGAIYQRSGDFAAAKEIFVKLANVYPKNSKYLAAAAALQGHFGETEEAIDKAQRAAAIDPEYAKESEIFIQQLKASAKQK